MTTTTLDSGTIEFVQNYAPAIDAGTYTLSVTQTVSSTDGKVPAQTFGSDSVIYVAAPRFNLPGGAVAAVFPPDAAQGEFSSVLPHAVLRNRMLPWVRNPGTERNPDAEGNIQSWLALMVFDSADPAPTPVQRTLAELTTTGSIVSYFPTSGPTYEPGESASDTCTTIDVPGDLFNAIAPSADDLYYVASARVAQGGDDNEPTHASLVVGNRLAVPRGRSVVHLVTLEGLLDSLPDQQGNGSVTASQSVRLVSLYSWAYGSVAAPFTFAGVVSSLDSAPMQVANPSPITGQTATGTLAQALSMGYVALTDQMRQGSQTVSWYRGPLVPFPLGLTENPLWGSADAALRYNPDTGMFDDSYAAAWQLGQLLALQNEGFSLALSNWKHAAQALALTAETIARLDQTFGNVFTLDNQDLSEYLLTQQTMNFVKNVLAPYLTPTKPS